MHVEAFLYKEARLADEARYGEWEDDATYWVPAHPSGDTDPERQISHIYNNRSRIRTRVKLLQIGHRYSQEPASFIRRLISNIVIEQMENREFVVRSNFLLLELSIQAKHDMRHWGGRTIRKLRQVDGESKMPWKQVLENMVLSGQHPEYNRTLPMFAEVVAGKFERNLRRLGSTTFKRKDLCKGFEPESYFYIQEEARIRG